MSSALLLLGSFSTIILLNKRRKQHLHKKKKQINNNVKKKKNQPEEYPVYSIGTVRSCFRECRGTPRQGLYAPSTRGKIILNTVIKNLLV